MALTGDAQALMGTATLINDGNVFGAESVSLVSLLALFTGVYV